MTEKFGKSLNLYYDGACPICVSEMRKLAKRDRAGDLRFINVADPGFAAHPEAARLPQMLLRIHVQRADASWLIGPRGLSLAYQTVGRWVMAWLCSFRLLGPLAEVVYFSVASNRYWLSKHLGSWLTRETEPRLAARVPASPRICANGRCALTKV